MSVATSVVNESKATFDHIMSIIRLFRNYLMKNNPISAAIMNVKVSIKNVLTANQKLKIARYRLSHYKYRLYQMEQLINENNTTNIFNGKNLNQLR